MTGLQSNVLPTPEGKDSVVLSLPDGYASYRWMRSGSPDTLGTAMTYAARTPGNYIARVTEQFGCSSSFSAPFAVVNAAGANAPDPAGGLIISPVSKTQLKLNWTDKPSPLYNETAFEIYRAATAGGPYTLVGKVNTDVLTLTDGSLQANTRYYYIVRAVNSNGAAPVSAEASGVTLADNQKPSAPGNLTQSNATRTSVTLSWSASSDDVGISKYDIYFNGKKTFTVPAASGTNTFNAYGLAAKKVYSVVVKARDVAGNESPSSNQVIVATYQNGLNYKFYTTTASWTALPDFNTLTPSKTGVVSTVSTSPRTQSERFAFVWQGWINIPTSGNYTFETNSDAGSKVYLGSEVYDPAATALVNNDGLHSSQYREGTVNLTRGTYPIIVTYFEVTGSDNITLYWKNTANGVGSRQAIPSQYFVDTLNLGSTPPTPTSPSVTVISHNKLRVNWSYSSTLETGFEVARSTSQSGTYTIIATVPANSVNYTDSLLTANTTYWYRVRAINMAGSSNQTSGVSGRTAVLPSIPTAPNTLAATAVSGTEINLTWKDNSSNETSFEVYRSANTNAAYVLIATVPANATANASYSDEGLFPNARYYYRVRAKNDGGTSGYTNEVNTLTQNSLPVITDIPDRTMRYGTTLSFNVGATDPDEEDVDLTATNAPAFVSYGDDGSGGIILTFNPGVGDQGTYNIQITATDQHGGVSNKTFALTVNDNYLPVLSNINNVTVAEKATASVNLSSSDQNASDPTNWTATGLPPFATLTPNGNTATIQLAPGYADGGAYPVTIKVDDGKGGFDTKDFTINVTNVNPNYAVYVNFTDGAYQGPAPWNNTNKRPAQGDVFPNLLNNSGQNSGISMSVLTPWQTINGGANTNNQGANTAGVYPAAVMTSNWWTQTVAQTIRLTGLNANYKYSFTFFGSRAGISDARVAAYTINGVTVTLNGTNNATQTVNINSVAPDVDGGITINIAPASGSTYAYINAMVVNAAFDDASAPAKPGNFAADAVSSGAKLTWSDQAYNETGYEVSRGAAKTGPFTILNDGSSNANDSTFTDATANSGQTWYYRVRALNQYGTSPYTDTLSVTIPNMPPALAAIANVNMKTDATVQVPVTATDAAGDVITLTATGLPAFANLQVNGNGNGVINLAPGGTDIGSYNITVKATDNQNGSTTRTFTVQVTDKKISSVYVNCNQVEPASAPWNNFNALPNTNAGINNMQDETGAASGVSVTILDVFTGANNVGAVTGDNSGVFPDNVMHTFFYDQSGADKRIRISGLSTARKYNLVFFGSRESVSDNRNTVYGAGGQTVTLNAASNTSNTVQINGLTPDASGNIVFTVRQATGSFSAYLNAFVIQSYVDDGTPLAPANLTATSNSRSNIQLTWADKSNNETGYEVWRSTTRNGTYSLLATVGANVTSYNNTGLAPNTVFFYKVRGIAGGLQSDFSNIATGGTLAYGIYVDFTVTQIQGAPWNATAALPNAGLSWNNLKDDVGNTTSVDLSIVNNFTGTNPAGAQTGNNSGVYPDKVLAESYYTETDTAVMLVSGLDQAKQYSFTFLGSRMSGGTRITAYKIGTKVVTLDANDNTSNTVTIENVKPNSEGEVTITVYTALNYGYINAMVIKAYPPDDSTSLQSLPQGTMSARTDGVGIMGAVSDGAATLQNNAPDPTDGINVEKVFPNPFTNFVNLHLTIGKQQKDTRILVRLLDMQGRLVQLKDLGTRGNGVYFERLDFGNSLQNGLYLLQVLSDDKPVKTLKLIKH